MIDWMINVLILVGATILDGVFGIGWFFTGLLILGTSVYFYSNNLVSVPVMMASVFVGAVICDNISFHIGRRAKSKGKNLAFSKNQLLKLEQFIDRFGNADVLVIVLGRSFSYVRPLVPFFMGFSGMGGLKFFLVSILSGFLWVGAWTAIALSSSEFLTNLQSKF